MHEARAYTGSKDNAVIGWDLETGKKDFMRSKWSPHVYETNGRCIQQHEGEVLAIATSYDGKYIAFGGRDSAVYIVDSRTNQQVKKLTGHRGAVTSLCFKDQSYDLFSGSFDRCIKHWDLKEMGYIETMFGHQVRISLFFVLPLIDRLMCLGRSEWFELLRKQTSVVWQ